MDVAVTIYGVCALSFMMVMYALESRSRHFVAAFALGCALSSVYGFMAGTWPFGVVEGVWALIALRRYAKGRQQAIALISQDRNQQASAANIHDQP